MYNKRTVSLLFANKLKIGLLKTIFPNICGNENKFFYNFARKSFVLTLVIFPRLLFFFLKKRSLIPFKTYIMD